MTTTDNTVKAPLNWSLIALIAFFLAVYVPLIMYGGIIVDDWGDIAHNLDCNGFFHCYQTWFPLFSNRPLAPLPITASTFIFGTFFKGYLILNTVVYLAAVLITRKAIAKLIGETPSIIFALFAAVPFIALPVIASPINQLTATVSFLLWALSTAALLNFINYQKVSSYVLAYLYLLLAFLTYEVILPLLVLTVSLPFIVNADSLRKNWFRYFLHYIMPVAVVLAIVILWQKGIAPQFMDVDSRLKLNPQQMLAKLHTWGHLFYAQIPTLFLKSLNYITTDQILTSTLFVLAVWFGYPSKTGEDNTLAGVKGRFFLMSFLCFVSSSSIFILSDESATSWGYQARGVSSTWFALCILIASVASYIASRKNILLLFISVFGVASTLSFLIQRDNYIKSWQLQMTIVEDALKQIKNNQVPSNAIVIGDVPKFINPNYNDEIVFSQPWDFGAALAIFTHSHIKDGAVIDSKRKDFSKLVISDQTITLNGWWKTNTTNLWLYEFDPVEKKGQLSHIQSMDAFKEKLSKLGYSEGTRAN